MDLDDDNEDVVVVSGEPTPQNLDEKVKSHNQYDGYELLIFGFIGPMHD